MQTEPPETVYQTIIEGGRQNSSSLLRMTVTLSNEQRAALTNVSDLSRFLTGAIRRFDGQDVAVYDEPSETMQGLRLPAACFEFSLAPEEDGVLAVEVHRKHLPVSKCFGGAPFVFAFVLAPPGPAPEVVVTRPFQCCSKSPAGGSSAPRPVPKRVRKPASSKPVPAPPTRADALIATYFAAADAAPVRAGALPSAASSSEEAATSPAAASAVGCKRARGGASAVAPAAPPASPSAKRGRRIGTRGGGAAALAGGAKEGEGEDHCTRGMIPSLLLLPNPPPWAGKDAEALGPFDGCDDEVAAAAAAGGLPGLASPAPLGGGLGRRGSSASSSFGGAAATAAFTAHGASPAGAAWPGWFASASAGLPRPRAVSDCGALDPEAAVGARLPGPPLLLDPEGLDGGMSVHPGDACAAYCGGGHSDTASTASGSLSPFCYASGGDSESDDADLGLLLPAMP